jgi:hypothetical protein
MSSAPPTTPHSPGRGPLLAFFLLTFVSYAYFDQGGGPNQFTRLALTMSLAERGSVAIDPYQAWTFDKALKDGHYYCDKAPGLSLLAVPIYALCRPAIERVTEPGSRNGINLALYLVTLFAVSLPVAVAMTAFYRRAWQEGGPRPAFWVAVALALGSPVAVYASLFYAHALCAALVWLAYELLTAGPEGAIVPAGRAATAGLLAGWATLSEFPVALLTAGLFVYLCVNRPRSWRAALAYVGGGIPPLAILLAYNVAAFGQPFASGYRYEVEDVFREAMGHGVMGITAPTVESVLGVFLLPFRGLFWFWPFFLCVPLAVPLLWEQRVLRGRVLLAAILVAVYLLFGCSYYFWSGATSFGPRHVIPCLPLAAYLVVRIASPLVRDLLVPVTAVLSVGVALIAVATLAEFPEPVLGEVHPERLNPLFHIALPRFVHGEMSVKFTGKEGIIDWSDEPLPRSDPRYYDACNLGEVIGLNGLASLVPLGVWWAGLGGYLWWRGRGAVADLTTGPDAEARSGRIY